MEWRQQGRRASQNVWNQCTRCKFSIKFTLGLSVSYLSTNDPANRKVCLSSKRKWSKAYFLSCHVHVTQTLHFEIPTGKQYFNQQVTLCDTEEGTFIECLLKKKRWLTILRLLTSHQAALCECQYRWMTFMTKWRLARQSGTHSSNELQAHYAVHHLQPNKNGFYHLGRTPATAVPIVTDRDGTEG